MNIEGILVTARRDIAERVRRGQQYRLASGPSHQRRQTVLFVTKTAVVSRHLLSEVKTWLASGALAKIGDADPECPSGLCPIRREGE